jgi:hypothetical protein
MSIGVTTVAAPNASSSTAAYFSAARFDTHGASLLEPGTPGWRLGGGPDLASIDLRNPRHQTFLKATIDVSA